MFHYINRRTESNPIVSTCHVFLAEVRATRRAPQCSGVGVVMNGVGVVVEGANVVMDRGRCGNAMGAGGNGRGMTGTGGCGCGRGTG